MGRAGVFAGSQTARIQVQWGRMHWRVIPKMVGMIPAAARGMAPRDVEKLKALVRAGFPEARQISAETLREWMAGANPPLLVDVRSAEEYGVSHLPGAVWKETASAIKGLRREAGQKLVLYCAVGFRSSMVAGRLQKEGVGEVYNLEGAIFEWANLGFPLEREGETVREIHSGNRQRAKLLKPEVKVVF